MLWIDFYNDQRVTHAYASMPQGKVRTTLPSSPSLPPSPIWRSEQSEVKSSFPFLSSPFLFPTDRYRQTDRHSLTHSLTRVLPKYTRLCSRGCDLALAMHSKEAPERAGEGPGQDAKLFPTYTKTKTKTKTKREIDR